MGKSMFGRRMAVGLAAAVLTVVAFASPVQAGAEVAAEASGRCADGQGFIDVAIIDDFSTTYNVYIDDELVDEGVTDSDDGVYTYGPFDDGVYNVRVEWLPDLPEEILNVDVTLDCGSDATTTETTAGTTTAATAAASAQPRFTG
jgi:hypothetical protein